MRQSIWNYLLIVAVSAAMGAAITWLLMSQRSTSAIRPTSAAQSNQMAQPNEPSAAPPDVTGMSTGDAAVTLGNFAYDHQRWPEAILRYQEAIASGIDNADIHTDLGNAFRFSGQAEQALNQYTIAQKLNPQHENSLFNQISLFGEVLNQPVRAAQVADEFIKRFPNSDKAAAVREQIVRLKGTPR